MMVTQLRPPSPYERRRAFTLVEMLIAMAVTLILMTALATGFSFVGQSIRDGRGEVQLSNQLRDITERLREELDSMTVSLRPNQGEADQLGYFMYYEGPLTDVTSAIFGIDRDDDGVAQLAHSRYGDFDDYLAFTAVATGDKWFTGKVPRFILDMKTAELRGETYDPLASGNPYFGTDPLSPVMIRSKYAEIVYFASPEYESGLGTDTPVYLDNDGTSNIGLGDFKNGLPDNLRLYRRVLLIRPDLNLTSGQLPTWTTNAGVSYMIADTWPTTTPTNNAWMYGMAGVHQQCDLSIRRVQATNGLPTRNVAANSLADLAKPHNRFAHVRVPGGLIGLNDSTITSMPVLALGPPVGILNATSVNGTRMAPPLPASGSNAIVTPSSLSGLLRPEFVLGQDPVHTTTVGDTWGLERIGEDLLANNLLAFDVKIYDPQAVSIRTSNNMVVGSNDPGFREALSESPLGPVMLGDYVDLAYPVLAGGALRGIGAMPLDRLQTASFAAIAPAVRPLLITPFSGVANFGGGLTNTYVESLLRSGKIVTDANQVRLFQPTFDTFTSSYETDGFVQGYVRPNSPVSAANVGGNAGVGTRWTPSNAAALVDIGRNGLDDDGAYGADDELEQETRPPFLSSAPAVRVTIRLENRDNRQLLQASVVHRDEG